MLEVRRWCLALGVPFAEFSKDLDKRIGKKR
jgi:hypothetical protein